MFFLVDISDEQRETCIFHGELIWRNTRQMLEKVPKRPPGAWNDLGKGYPLVNEQLDPENHQFLVETNLRTPMTARV